MRFPSAAAVVAAAVFVALVPAAARAQAPAAAPVAPPPLAAPAGRITGIVSFGHTVVDLDKSVEFYKDAFGLQVAAPVGRPAADGPTQKLLNVPGARFRQAVLALPESGFSLRLLEFTGIDRKAPLSVLKTDPGVSNLQIRIKSMDETFPRLQKWGVQILTVNAKPLVQTFRKSVMIRDLDGYVIEVVEQSAPVPLFTPGITMTSAQAPFYQGVLGFAIRTFQWGSLPATYGTIPDGQATSIGSARRNEGMVPGTTVRLELDEYSGLTPTTFKPRIQDPAATLLTLRVRDMDEMLKVIRDLKVTVISAGGVSVQMPGSRNLVIQDPEGVYLELVQLP